MADNRGFTGIYLSEYQMGFVRKFLEPTSHPYHLLFAPIGSGKTITAITIVNESIRSGAQKVLIIAPSIVVADQYRKIMSDFIDSSRIVFVSTKIIREADVLNNQGTFWNNTICITTWDFAKDRENQALFSSQWDLIIIEIDHVSYRTQRARLLKSLIKEDRSKRILFISQSQNEINNIKKILSQDYGKLIITQWNQPIPTVSPHIYIGDIYFQRTKEEQNFIEEYLHLSQWLREQKYQSQIRSRLVSSSIFAAEDSLRRLRNQVVHNDLKALLISNGEQEEFLNEDELSVDINIERVKQLSLQKKHWNELVLRVSNALNKLEKVQSDSKLDSLLDRIQGFDLLKESRIWIYASYKATISYLYSSLKETYPKVYQLHGELSASYVAEALNQFTSDGGILIASTSRLMGVNLPINALFLYDVPDSGNQLYTILTRMTTQFDERTDTSLQIYYFDDTTNVIGTEKIKLRKLQEMLYPRNVNNMEI